MAVIRKPTATGPIQIYYIHADHLNTPRVIVNTANTIVWRWENTHAFGANLPDEDPDGNAQLFEYHPRFPGQYFDSNQLIIPQMRLIQMFNFFLSVKRIILYLSLIGHCVLRRNRH